MQPVDPTRAFIVGDKGPEKVCVRFHGTLLSLAELEKGVKRALYEGRVAKPPGIKRGWAILKARWPKRRK